MCRKSSFAVDFLDAIFYCPYNIYELMTKEYLLQMLRAMSEEHKAFRFLCVVQLFSSTRIAKTRGKVIGTSAMRVARCSKDTKKLLASRSDKAGKQQPMALLEKKWFIVYGLSFDNAAKTQY